MHHQKHTSVDRARNRASRHAAASFGLVLCAVAGADTSRVRLVADLTPGIISSSFTGQFRGTTGLAFLLQPPTSSFGQYYWTDGTAEGTRWIAPTANEPRPFEDGFTTLGDFPVVFEYVPRSRFRISCYDPSTGNRVWSVEVPQPGRAVARLVSSGGVVYAISSADSALGHVVRTDGTQAGTRTVFAGTRVVSAQDVDGTLLFGVAANNIEDGVLYRVDAQSDSAHEIARLPRWTLTNYGAVAGRAMYIDQNASMLFDVLRRWHPDTGFTTIIEPGTGAQTVHVSRVAGRSDGSAYFIANVDGSGYSPYFTDGTATGTRKLGAFGGAEVLVNSMMLAVGSDIGYFMVGSQYLWKLWSTDGTPAGTRPVTELPFTPVFTWPMVATRGRVVMPGRTSAVGQELWTIRVDGPPDIRLFDILPGQFSSAPRIWGTVNSRVFFRADDGSHGNELHVLDLCPVDLNNDGRVSGEDVFKYVAAYLAGLGSSDVDDVEGVTVQDLFSWLAAWFAGCN